MTVSTVKSARKDQGHCQVCSKEIKIGDPYKWASINRFTGKMKRCIDCPPWKPSELCGSKMATAMAAQEDAHDALDKLEVPEPFDAEAWTDDVQSILTECASQGGECRDEYQEGFDNMPENFQEGDAGQQIQEKIDALESWCDEMESFSPSSDYDAEEENAVEVFTDEVLSEARDLVDALEV